MTLLSFAIAFLEVLGVCFIVLPIIYHVRKHFDI